MSEQQHDITLIHGKVQTYDWGKLGHNSIAAQLAHAAECTTVDDSTPYAELWLGTHDTAHSTCPKHDHKKLADHIDTELPYLFKILSINKALSIQAHPDKQLAVQLHARDSKNYKDNNHKPEMAIAITPFEAMCGFRSITQIAQYLRDVPELTSIIGDEAVQTFVKNANNDSEESNKAQLKHLFYMFMSVKQDVLDQHIPTLIQRLQSQQNGSHAHTNGHSNGISDDKDAPVDLDVAEVVLRLHKDFKYDIGILCPYFLNCVRMQPGQSLFLGPNLPHAYISGDIVECMAQSDNVVRAGLTPKFRDVNTLISMLTYETGHVTQLKPVSLDSNTVRYAPADKQFDEFALTTSTIQPNKGEEPYMLRASGTHSILLTYSGTGYITSHIDKTKEQHKLGKGVAYLIHDGVDVDIVNTGNDSLVIYRCSTNEQQ